jgi:hypothetical protein
MELLMGLSNKEKSLIISLIVTLLIFGWYFFGVFSNVTATSSEQLGFNDVIRVIFLIAILEGIIAWFFQKKGEADLVDERDKLIDTKSYRNSYWTLCIGVWFILMQLLFEASGPWSNAYHTLVFTSPIYIAHLLLLFFVLSEVIHFSTQLYHYRRGI